MEDGNRCKDECLPEETNRRIVEVISDVNVCYNKLTEFNSNNTDLWTVEQVKAKLMELSYVRDELAKWESR